MQPETLPGGKLTGQVIIDQLVRNMELGQFEMAYSILVPCVFSLYLHPDDYARLSGVMNLLREDARRALTNRLRDLNAKPSVFARGRASKDRKKEYKTACKEWSLEFFPDREGVVPAGDVEIHSELNETPQPGYHGAKTTLLGREPGVIGSARDDETRPMQEVVYAEIRYEDDSGVQLFPVTQNEITVGRGGGDARVNLPLYTKDEVSREHLKLKRDPEKGDFTIIDVSRNGTWVNGKRVRKGAPVPLPDRATIGVAEVLTLNFEVKR